MKTGQLTGAVAFPQGLLSSITEYVHHGMLYIRAGPDHVLLVVCQTLCFGFWRPLLWAVTAFTAGHSVTLISR